MKVYEFTNYKKFLNEWIELQPRKGRGFLTQLAQRLGVHTTLLSHTLRGDRDLTMEQAFATCEFIGLSSDETNYFLLLVQIERAGTLALKNKYKSDLRELKTKSQILSSRVQTDAKLTEAQAAQFYSSWIYAAIRQMSSLDKYQTRAQLNEALPIRRDETNRAIDFLTETGLCIEKNGKIFIGPSKTHIDSKSPLVFLHHKNWRLKAIEKHNNLSDDELMYSAPFTVSNDDFLKFRENVVQLIQQLVFIADKTKPEKLACFNVDLFFV